MGINFVWLVVKFFKFLLKSSIIEVYNKKQNQLPSWIGQVYFAELRFFLPTSTFPSEFARFRFPFRPKWISAPRSETRTPIPLTQPQFEASGEFAPKKLNQKNTSVCFNMLRTYLASIIFQ